MTSRRTTLVQRARGLAAASALGAVGIAYHSRHIAPLDAVLERVEIVAPRQRSGSFKIRIGFLADTHIGPVIRASDVERALARLASAEPDILLLGGDYVCESPRYIADAAAVLGNFAKSMRLGALAVLGNHDHANDASRVAGEFERRGIRVLQNESARISTPSGDLWVAGIDDAVLGSPDPHRAFARVPADGSALALWHEPDWAEQAAAHGAFLQLSGHSHGGQVRVPFLGTIAAPMGGRRFVSGLNDAGGMPVYTTRGVGVFRPPVRLRCPPEVTLITLRELYMHPACQREGPMACSTRRGSREEGSH